ncbi:MAG: hypothetical protein QHH24_02915 [Candidatus Bathyarchaeota archaeon]|nr:hypothetical protein [Candidatus Bathyarchaeota archaeon]
MRLLRNKWFMVSLLLACWALIASFLAAYYTIRYLDLHERIGGVLMSVNIGIDYGNGSRTWLNQTKAFSGQTLFDVTKQVANVTYNTGAYGTEILSINAVSKQGSFGWTYWVWNSTANAWLIVWENVDSYVVANGETFMWYYQNGFNPPP